MSRTGQNLNETILTPATVSSGNFGKLFSLTVDGAVTAQPLYMSGLTVGGTVHNVTFIATGHNSVFAFDADAGGAPLWQVSLMDAAHGAAAGATSVPDSFSGCTSQTHEYGITGTPVIDPGTGTLYVVSNTLENAYPVYRLHALDITSGAEKMGGPTTIAATIAGTGAGSSSGFLSFDANLSFQRAGLAMANGVIYIAFASHCDFGNYHGWVFAYNAASLAQTSVFNPTPNGVNSGIWMSGAAPSIDTVNGVTRMFLATGNGTYDATSPYGTNTMDYGDDILQLNLSNGMQVTDAFTPYNQAALQKVDGDLGSGGPMLLPDQPGNYPHLLIETSKAGVIYLVNRDNLGGYGSTTNNIVQELDNLAGSWYGLPAYWNGNIYSWPSHWQLQQFTLTNGLLSSTPVAISAYQQTGGLGSTPSLSANGNTNGIVWALDPSQSTQVLYAHDATNVGNMLWNSGLNSTRDAAGRTIAFLVPTVASGKVFVGSIGQVSVYGLLTAAQTITFGAIPVQTIGTPLTLSATASSGLPVSYASLTSSICTVASSSVTFLTAGTCTINASQAGNSSYSAATVVSQSFMVTAPGAIPPQIGYLAFWGVNNSGVTISWSTDVLANTVLAYGPTTQLGQFVPTQTALSNSHGVVLTGLNPGTTYYFVAESTGANGATGYSSIVTFTTTGTAPISGSVSPVISGVTAAVSGGSATITWTTDQASSSQVNYGISTAYGSSSVLAPALVTAHSVTLTGLAAGTTYDFDVVSANSAGASTASPNSTLVAAASTGPAPVVGYLAFWGINNTGATVTWSTDSSATTQLAYGVSPALGQLSPVQTALTASHGVVLTGLNPGTTYYFQALSAGSNGVTGTSTVYNFTTTGTPAPSPAPIISAVTVASVTGTSATVTWTTDQASSSQINYGGTTSYGASTNLDTALVTSHSEIVSGLIPGTSYNFDVVSVNSSGTADTSANYQFQTPLTAVTPPVISNVSTSSITSNSVTITWTTDQATSSLVNYGTSPAYGSSSALQPSVVTSHSVTLTGLAAGTTYNFDIVAVTAGGASTTSANTTVSTSAASGAAPYVGYVAYWGVSNSGVTISWSTDVLANTQLAYGTTAAFGQLTPLQTALTASHGVVLTGLNSGTTYYFQAQSTSAGGVTGTSATYQFTTTGVAAVATAPVLSQVTYTNVTSSSATLTWTTDQPSSSQVNYGTATAYGSSSTLDPTSVTSHSVTLTGLLPGTTYNFNVVSANASSASSSSTNVTFVTSSASALPPVISSVASSGLTSGSAVITWTTDQASSSQVNYGASLSYGSSSVLNPALTTSHSVTLTGLLPATTYDFDVVSGSSTSGNYMFTTPSASGNAPVISYIASWGITSSGANISWSTNVPASTALAYGITSTLGTLTPVQSALTASHGVVLTGLNPGTTYYFVAQSADGNGNTGYSTSYSFTTSAGAPTISGLVIAPASNNTAVLSWTTSSPAYSFVQYGSSSGNYNRYSAQTTLTTTPTCTLTYVPSGTVYYQLVSTDAFGNQTVSPEGYFTEP